MAAGRTAGWFDAAEDMDWYRLDLAAGQRFHVELQGGRLGDQRPLMKLVSPTGEVLNLTPSLHAGPSDVQDFSAVAPVAGRHSLLVAAPPAAWPGAPLPLPYQLSLSNIGADAEPDRRVDALRLVPDQSRSASFDQTGDRDTYAVDAVAGQRVLFEVYGIGFQVSSYAARLYGPGDTDTGIATLSSLSQIRFVSAIEQSGRFTLDLQSRAEIGGPATAVPVGYTVTAHLLPADDHAGTFGAAEALAVGQTARGVLDLPGDLDAFAVDLGGVGPQGVGAHVVVALHVDAGGDEVVVAGAGEPGVVEGVADVGGVEDRRVGRGWEGGFGEGGQSGLGEGGAAGLGEWGEAVVGPGVVSHR